MRSWPLKIRLAQLVVVLYTTLLSSMPTAFAVAPVISTSTTIAHGALDPAILVNSGNFFTDLNKYNFTVDAGTTGLTFDSVAFINPTRVRINLRGTAQAGSISVQASVSAFEPVADSQSNTLTITVPNPLVSQTITFDALTPITVNDDGQILSASSTSGLDVSFSSITPNTCRIVSRKIQALVAGTCTIKASQSGNSTYQSAVDIIQTVLISPAPSEVADNPVTHPPAVNTIGTLDYSPDSSNTSYKEFNIFPHSFGQNGATTVKLQVPIQATKTAAVFLVSSYSSYSENDQGFFVARVQLADKSGMAITQIEKVYKINMPRGYFYSEIYWSSDGLMWQRILETLNKLLPNDTHASFFREVDGSVSILTNQLGLFGYRFPQEDLKVHSPIQTLALSGQIELSYSGGSGTGAITFGTSTSAVCSVTSDGVLRGKQPGKCFVFVRKYAAQFFIDTVSTMTVITIEKPIITVPKSSCNNLAYSLVQSASQVEAIFCPKNTGQVATLYVRVKTSANKWVDKKVATVIIDSNGLAVFKVTRKIGTSKFLHVFIDGKHGI